MKSSMKIIAALGCALVLSSTSIAQTSAQTSVQNKAKHKAAPNGKIAAKATSKVAPKAPPKASTPMAAVAAPAAPTRAPAALDPNRAVEVRGQSRTLSMMLVLKNGKENINFIRVRKDYNAEIRATEF